jgi:predicted nuclease with TOPRIM domain
LEEKLNELRTENKKIRDHQGEVSSKEEVRSKLMQRKVEELAKRCVNLKEENSRLERKLKMMDHNLTKKNERIRELEMFENDKGFGMDNEEEVQNDELDEQRARVRQLERDNAQVQRAQKGLEEEIENLRAQLEDKERQMEEEREKNVQEIKSRVTKQNQLKQIG